MARRGENIRKRTDGRLEGRYTVKMPDGQHKSRSVYAATYGEARDKLIQAKSEAQNGIQIRNGEPAKMEITVGQTAENWLEQVLTTRKYATYVKYRSVYTNYLQSKIADKSWQELNMKKPDQLLFDGENTVSDNTKITVYSVFGQLVKYAAEKYYLPVAPLEKPCIKRKKTEIDVFNFDEQAKLIKFLWIEMDIFKLGILLCLHTGLRLGELCALKWSDFDFKRKILHVNRTVQRITLIGGEHKTGLYECEPKSSSSRREIPLPDILAEKLTAYQKNQPYIFYGDKPMEPRTYQKKLKSYLETCEIPNRNFHVLRHTFATNCVANGMDVKCLSEIMGHSEVQITLNRYVHPSLETKRQHLNELGSIYGQYIGHAV